MIQPDWLPNFKISDFQCHCHDCAEDAHRPATKPEVMRATQDLRDRLGRPVFVSRGVSCEAHNANVGGARDSRHLPQHADGIDVTCASAGEAYAVVETAIDQGCWTVIRVYKTHVHLDQRPGMRMFLASPEC